MSNRMTVKTIALLKARAGLSRAQFIDYYETRHAPLVRELMPGIVDYRRNYVDSSGAFTFAETPPFDYDSVTEIWFADRAAYDAAIAAISQPESAARLAADEENFIDRAKTRMFVVEERS
jgi:uncharacterized protein (TIGR02118 family)